MKTGLALQKTKQNARACWVLGCYFGFTLEPYLENLKNASQFERDLLGARTRKSTSSLSSLGAPTKCLLKPPIPLHNLNLPESEIQAVVKMSSICCSNMQLLLLEVQRETLVDPCWFLDLQKKKTLAGAQAGMTQGSGINLWNPVKETIGDGLQGPFPAENRPAQTNIAPVFTWEIANFFLKGLGG